MIYPEELTYHHLAKVKTIRKKNKAHIKQHSMKHGQNEYFSRILITQIWWETKLVQTISEFG